MHVDQNVPLGLDLFLLIKLGLLSLKSIIITPFRYCVVDHATFWPRKSQLILRNYPFIDIIKNL